MLKMILKDLRLSPLRSILTSVSMLVGIIAMLGSVLVGTLGREYLISQDVPLKEGMTYIKAGHLLTHS